MENSDSLGSLEGKDERKYFLYLLFDLLGWILGGYIKESLKLHSFTFKGLS